MPTWPDVVPRRLTRRQTLALVALGIVVAAGVSQATRARGPVGVVSLVGVMTLVVAALTMFTITLGRLLDAREETQEALAQVDSMVQNSPVGMAFVDTDLRFVEINEALAALNGRSIADHIGRRVDEVDVLRDTEIPVVIAEVLRTGEPRLDLPFSGFHPQSGQPMHDVAGYYPVRGAEGAITGIGIVVREVSAEHERDVFFERVSRLQELTAALSTAGTVEEVVATAVRSVQRAVNALTASFCRLDGDTVRVEGSVGFSADVIDPFATFPVSMTTPIGEAMRTGVPVLCATHAEAIRRFPELGTTALLGSSRSVAALPLRGESAVFGAIGITFEDEHAFSDDEVAFLVATTTQCATAFERAIAFEAERAARRGAEAANDRLSYLSEATAVLAQSLDPETTMQRLAELAVPTLGDWCAVHLVEGNFAVAVAMASENPEATAMVRDLSDRHPISLDARAGLGAVIRTGRPVVARRVTIDDVRASTDEGEIVDLLSRLTSIAIVPMIFQGKAIGAVTLSNTTDRILDDAEVQLASELASRAAQAITNARLYQERTAVASTLQASLMPRSPTLIPGVDVATRFVPAQGLDVGGDFYDIFRLGTVDEPAPTWALVIGDVRGKGADAAAITGIARATIRATALDETSPATMLSRLNQVLLAAAQDDRFAAESSEPRFCTACVITVTPSEGGADLVVAVGGHPLPYVLRAGGGVDQVGHYGGLIGVMPSPMLVDVPVHLAPGDALVLYTDGVTERHEGRTFFDEEGLASVLADCAGAGPAEIAESVELRSRGFVDAEPKDDLCIVVARVPEVSRGSLARTTLPSDDSAAALARAFVHDALVAIDAPEVVERAVLLTSELVTNALLHGEPALHVEVLAVPDGVRVAVSDEHPDLPTPRYAEREDEHGRGLRLVEALASKWGVDARSPGKTVWFELDL